MVLSELAPIGILLLIIALVVTRLPRVDVGHTAAFRTRRFVNWFPVGLTYAFLYMGRYNLNACVPAVMSKAEFSSIYGWGTLVYGVSFIINGPLADRFGGKATILAAAIGSSVMNIAMGAYITHHGPGSIVGTLSLLYAANMYFQSFGAVSIVKVNSAWFHLRERGTFGGIFGILISLGIYFAFDWSRRIAKFASPEWVFFVPAILLILLAVADGVFVRDTPGQAGHTDFDPGDASSGDDGPRLPVFQVAKLMLRSPIIMTIAAVEFCSGYLRNAIMQYFPFFAKEIGIGASYVPKNWGMLLCVAGILGGVFAGTISDRLFQSRRGPVSAVLYGGMLVGAIAMFPLLSTTWVGFLVVFMSLCIIGVHGMLSGTASMDFGGKKNVGVAVGLIDGFVYLGSALEAWVLGIVLPKAEAAKSVANWWTWPAVMLPAVIIGLALAARLWNAKPARRVAAH